LIGNIEKASVSVKIDFTILFFC